MEDNRGIFETKYSRREFLQKAIMAGVSAGAVASLGVVGVVDHLNGGAEKENDRRKKEAELAEKNITIAIDELIANLPKYKDSLVITQGYVELADTKIENSIGYSFLNNLVGLPSITLDKVKTFALRIHQAKDAESDYLKALDEGDKSTYIGYITYSDDMKTKAKKSELLLHKVYGNIREGINPGDMYMQIVKSQCLDPVAQEVK